LEDTDLLVLEEANLNLEEANLNLEDLEAEDLEEVNLNLEDNKDSANKDTDLLLISTNLEMTTSSKWIFLDTTETTSRPSFTETSSS